MERKENNETLAKLAIETEMPKAVLIKDSIKIEVYDFKAFEKFLQKDDGTTYVINFWATWCAPCVKELPYFEQLQEKYADKDVEVILVSLDMPKMYETHLIPFVKKKNLELKIIALDDPKQNSWIPKVDKNWSGAIPATYIYRGKAHQFIESSLEFDELEQLTLNIKNKKQ
ncbi:TlpA disulfide reductase family protein [Ascidiimonas sp. W6]|uniref:TlpA disulfide reductase family protein n=1 Tax=Ascidiimonas meishanensis TaxID=3128903 RepID=UPI0030EB40F7